MKNFLLIIFIVLSINSFSQCTYSVTATNTPASCSTCCDGVITANVSGSGFCAPSTFQLLPIYVYSAIGTWSNLCSGTYTVEYITSCCTTQFICFLPFTATNVKETNNSLLTINAFPNPVSNTLFISTDRNQQENSEIEIVNYLGQTVLRTRFKKEIDVSDLPNGMYFLQLKNPQGQVAMKRLVIAR